MKEAFIREMKKILSRDKRIKSSVDDMVKKASVSNENAARAAMSAGQSNYTRTVQPSMNWIFRILLVFILIFTIFSFGIISMIIEVFSGLFNTSIITGMIGESASAWLSVIIPGFIILIIITAALPFKDMQEVVRKEFKVAFIIIILILGIGGVMNSDFMLKYSYEEKEDIITENTKSNYMSLIDEIKCSFSPECIRMRMNENDARETRNSKYDITFRKPISDSTIMTLKDLDRKMPLYYTITSTNDMNIQEIKCYFNEREEENLLDTITINETIKTTISNKYEPNLGCDLSKAKDMITENDEKYKIITVLTLDTVTQFNQEIPVINYQELLEKEGLDPNEYYSRPYLQGIISSYVKDSDKEFTKTNDAISVKTRGLNDKLPIVSQDEEQDEIRFTLAVEKDQYTNFGKLIAGRIEDITLPSSLTFGEETTASDYTEEIQFEDQVYEKIISVKENPSNQLDTFMASSDMKMRIAMTFEKTDYFQIYIKDEEIEKMIVENKNESKNVTEENMFAQEKKEIEERLQTLSEWNVEYGEDEEIATLIEEITMIENERYSLLSEEEIDLEQLENLTRELNDKIDKINNLIKEKQEGSVS